MPGATLTIVHHHRFTDYERREIAFVNDLASFAAGRRKRKPSGKRLATRAECADYIAHAMQNYALEIGDRCPPDLDEIGDDNDG